MRNIWMLLTLGLTAFLSGERIVVSAAKSVTSDDLYLEDTGSGGYPEDDDDFSSGSGSGAGEEVEEVVTVNTLFIAPKAEPTQDTTKDFTPRVEISTSRDIPREMPRKPVRTEPPAPVTEDLRKNPLTSTTSSPRSPVEPFEVRSENLFQRTEVLAAVIAGGVIGFLFAIFLILLLVYRMRKKDEGSYDLGERKPSGAAYQKAPTKEFYA
ncbi:syndecan-2 [Colossoma macropomum]|uniref:syndecan-2 n=1 Tax=Colossoma macropomum TaxID=42526 RepID=UPI001864013D|nr:syndecan-2 [Colossoma macropomum]XP_036422540.1 syndecan-2 [Colossoma macropomum]XP_036422542.1 syndecan-2 [Colossoma macropomum]